MPSLSINAIEMHFEHYPQQDTGHYPLLLLAGMASDNASWQPVVPQLAKRYELLLPDNRCCGRTRPIPVDISRQQMVHDLLCLLDALGIDKVNILGHSMGGMLGWALAAQAPDRVNHLISACAQAWVIPGRISLFKSLDALRTDENDAHWLEMFYHFLFSPSFFEDANVAEQVAAASMAYPYRQSREAFSLQAAALQSFSAPVDLSSITCAISMVTGDNDVLMTPSSMQAFCAAHNYPFSTIPDAAHAIHWEQPELFANFVISALDTSG